MQDANQPRETTIPWEASTDDFPPMLPLDECNAHKSHPEEVWSPSLMQINAALDAYGVEYDSPSIQAVAIELAVKPL